MKALNELVHFINIFDKKAFRNLQIGELSGHPILL